MPGPEFIRINDEAVRLTSFTREGDAITAIVVLRGPRDHEQLAALLDHSPVLVALPGEDPRPMMVARNEFTSTGAGPTALYRHVISFRSADSTDAEPPAAPEPLEQRLARIEEKLDRVLRLLASPPDN